MTTQIKESKIIVWILLPVFLSLVVSAIVGLQLFQDGSSYLLEMLIDHSAVRHGRVSILLFQYPTIILIKTFHRLEIDTLITLPVVRLAFNLNYALTPFISLLLSWLVVRKKREELFIWAALIILFVNLVNFSWVSELLISVQLSCPLLLALLQNPRSKTFWSLFILLTPFIFFLHPLVIAIYLILATASAYVAFRQPVYRNPARLSMILFLLAVVGRGIYSFFALNLYEVSFAASGEVSDYFTITRWENILFLVVAVEIALLVLMSQLLIHLRTAVMNGIHSLVFLQSSVFLFFTAAFLLLGDLPPMVLMGCIAAPALLQFWYVRNRTTMQNTRSLYVGYAFLAVAVSIFLMAQYVSDARLFTLKTGLSLLAALLIMMMAAIDGSRDHTPDESAWRIRLVAASSMIFAVVVITRSIMWQASSDRLEQTLRQTEGSCAEMTSAGFRWLEKSPYTMLNNWALPSLALVLQDEHPRKALLAQNDCQLFYQSGMAQVDPWSLFSKEYIVPPLE